MSYISLVVGVFVLASGVWQQPPPVAPPDSGRLRWIRGILTDASPSSLTVQLTDEAVTVPLDRDTRTMRPAGDAAADLPKVGSLIEVHFVDKKPVQRAVLIIDGVSDRVPAPKRAGRSYRGLVTRARWGSVFLKVDKGTRGVSLDKKTRLTAVDGGAIATGSKEVTGLLKVGEEVLVTYDEQSDDLVTGDTFVAGSHDLALEIRKLGN